MLASLEDTNGQYVSAIKHLKKGWRVIQNANRENHPLIIDLHNNIANNYRETGQHDSALWHLEKALFLNEKIQPENEKKTAMLYNNLGLLYERMWKLNKALLMHQKSLALRKKILPNNDDGVAIAYNNLGLVYIKLNALEKSLEAHNKALKIYQIKYKGYHPNIAKAYNNIAQSYELMKLYDEAMRYNIKSKELYEKILHKNHPFLAIIYNNIGVLYKKMKAYELALVYIKRAIDNYKNFNGHENTYLCYMYDNLGVAFQNLNQYDSAFYYFENSLSIRLKKHHKFHPVFGYSYYYLAALCHEVGYQKKAKQHIQKALKVFTHALPGDHPYIDKTKLVKSKIYQTIAQQAYLEGKNIQALTAYEAAAATWPAYKDAAFYTHIGLIYANSGAFEKAKAAFEQYERLHPQSANSLRNWAAYHALRGQKTKALQFLEKAVLAGYAELDWLKADPSMKPLTDKKQFERLIERLTQQADKG